MPRRSNSIPPSLSTGPLTASLCLDLAARQFGSNRLTRFAFRGVSPAFADRPLRIAGTRLGDDLAFVVSAEGRVVARASATLGSTLHSRRRWPANLDADHLSRWERWDRGE